MTELLYTTDAYVSEFEATVTQHVEGGVVLDRTAFYPGGGGQPSDIGSYCGKSTVYLGAAVKKAGGVLFAVDHHRGSEEHQLGEEYHDPALYDGAAGLMDSFREFRATMRRAGLEDTVVPVVAPTRVAARPPTPRATWARPRWAEASPSSGASRSARPRSAPAPAHASSGSSSASSATTPIA